MSNNLLTLFLGPIISNSTNGDADVPLDPDVPLEPLMPDVPDVPPPVPPALNSTHLALFLVTPLIPSMVDPVQAFNNN